MLNLHLADLEKKAKELVAHLFQKNEYERELKDLENQSRKNPDDMRIKLQMAETCFKSREIARSVALYREVAEFYEKEDFILKAVAAYKNMLKIEPDHLEINIRLAELYTKLDMVPDAVNQYRIAMEGMVLKGSREELIETAKKLVALDPSPTNRRKLAEIYHVQGMHRESVKEYEAMAVDFKKSKKYDDLLRVCEMILPHQPHNQDLVRDVCILYLRRQEPENAIRTIEQHKMESEPAFADLMSKARQMHEILRKAHS